MSLRPCHLLLLYASSAGPLASWHQRFWPAFIIPLAFALFARWLRAVSPSGAVAGAVCSFVLFFAAGPGAFVAVAAVFTLTFAATRLGYGRKQFLGTAERKGGRTGSQVIANLGVATACALAALWVRPASGVLCALAAALSEAAADTVSSEYGQAVGRPAYLITTWQIVPAGTNGGVTFSGTLAGVTAAIVVTVVCAATGVVDGRSAISVAAAAILGMFADSYFGALFESDGKLNNHGVNFLSTATAAVLAAVFVRWL